VLSCFVVILHALMGTTFHFPLNSSNDESLKHNICEMSSSTMVQCFHSIPFFNIPHPCRPDSAVLNLNGQIHPQIVYLCGVVSKLFTLLFIDRPELLRLLALSLAGELCGEIGGVGLEDLVRLDSGTNEALPESREEREGKLRRTLSCERAASSSSSDCESLLRGAPLLFFMGCSTWLPERALQR
jgi:hypothetical protein